MKLRRIKMENKISLDPSEVIKQLSTDFATEIANKQQEISMLKVQIRTMQEADKETDKKE